MGKTDAPLLSGSEQQVVALIDAGFTRWKIAELMGVSEDTVRGVIRRLCERFDCRMEELPDAVADDAIRRREEQ